MLRRLFGSDLRVVLLCWFGYSAAYVGRLNMGASILPMSESLGWSLATLGSIVSCFFLVYAGGQLASGVLAHFLEPRWSFGCALAASAICNLLVPLFPSPGALRVIWACNGAAQALMWCSVVKAFAQRVSERGMPNAIVAISATVSCGTVTAYGAAALCAELRFWQGSFYFSAALLGLAALLWIVFYRFPAEAAGAGAPHAAAKAYPRATRFADSAESDSATDPPWSVVAGLVACVSLAGAACGFLRDGVTNWAPKILSDFFQLRSSLSILLTLTLPLVGILGAYLNKVFHRREPLIGRMSAFCFLAASWLVTGAAAALMLPSLVLAVASLAGVALTMIMVTNALTSMFQLAYRSFFDAALVAGIVDTFCYVGSSGATYLLGRAADDGGWDPVFLLLGLAAAAGFALSVASAKLERRLARTGAE